MVIRSLRKPGRGCARQRREIAGLALFALALLVVPAWDLIAQHDNRDNPPAELRSLPPTELTEEEAVAHALNRLAYGPRPGEAERVQQAGLAAWIERQLRPESINDSAVDSRLERFPTLKMSSQELLERYPAPQVAARRAGMTPEEYRRQQEQTRERLRAGRDAGQQQDEGGMSQPGMRMDDAALATPQRIIAELAMARTVRALYSERQLYEQMVDFWFNHFNVFAGKGADRWLVTAYERDAIRPHAMGKFRDLLEATAKSPAMLFYLDNWQSVDPESAARLEQDVQRRMGQRAGRRVPGIGPRVPLPGPAGPSGESQPPQAQRPARGLNENYGRELLELHTLGVDGGYTEQDVREVARAFTGWTIRAPRRDPEFWFNGRVHDPRPKTVLGRQINAGGIQDGEQVLDLLARHPQTARHISFKLARRFVSDEPPAELVERMARTFQQTDGDIRAVLRTMLGAPEFWSREAYRAKIKTPFALVVSAARAMGAETEIPLALTQWSARIGEPLYMCQPPTGYADTADAWVNTGALLNRLNYALALAGNRLRGVRVDAASLFAAGENDGAATLERAMASLLSGQVSSETRRILERQIGGEQALPEGIEERPARMDASTIAGLVLGAPEFQRR